MSEDKKMRSNDKIEVTVATNENAESGISAPDSKEKKGTRENYGKQIIWTQIIGTIICSLVLASAGVVFGYTGIALPSMMDPESHDIILSKTEAFIYSSISNIGSMIGCLISIPAMILLGQRSILLIFLPVGIVSWFILKITTPIWLLMVSRVMQGMVIGVSLGAAGNYITEISHESFRGRLHAISGLFLQAGLLLVYLVGSSSITWRNVGLFCGLTTMFLPFVGMIFLPHSPRWLVLHDRMEEAKNSLIYFRGKHFNAVLELNEIIQLTARQKTSIKTQFKKLTESPLSWRFMAISSVFFLTHFTGNFAMMTYSVSIFESANLSINSYFCTVLTGITRIIGNVIYLILSDKFGRKFFYISSQLLCGISMVIVGIFFYLKPITDDLSSISWLPISAFLLFSLVNSLPTVILAVWQSELLPNTVRAIGTSLLYEIYFIGVFSATLSFPYMVDWIGSPCTFYTYGAISCLCVMIAAKYMPETKGKTLEEINEHLT